MAVTFPANVALPSALRTTTSEAAVPSSDDFLTTKAVLAAVAVDGTVMNVPFGLIVV